MASTDTERSHQIQVLCHHYLMEVHMLQHQPAYPGLMALYLAMSMAPVQTKMVKQAVHKKRDDQASSLLLKLLMQAAHWYIDSDVCLRWSSKRKAQTMDGVGWMTFPMFLQHDFAN